MADAVKCVYCFKEFLPKDAHFRAKSEIRAGFAVQDIIENYEPGKHKQFENLVKNESNIDLINFEEKRMDGNGYVLDEKLKRYYKEILFYDEYSAENKSRQLPWFTRHCCYIKNKVVVDPKTNREYIASIEFDEEKYQSSKSETDERLCPHCHNPLPPGFGIRDCLILSVIGDTFSGKTVFLTVLLHELMKSSGFIEGTLRPTGNESLLRDRDSIDMNDQFIYKKRIVPEATPPGKTTQPLLYNYNYVYLDQNYCEQRGSIDIAIYDIAGENCREAGKLEARGLHVKNSNGIILLMNPMQIHNIASYYRNNDFQLMGGANNQLDVIDAIYKNFLGLGNTKSTIPFALVLSKVDRFWDKDVRLPYFDSHPFSPLLIKNDNSQNKGKGFLDKGRIEDFSDEVLEFLEESDLKSFVQAMKAYFEKYSFFAISALGQNPKIIEKDDTTKEQRIMSDVKPFRILDPFYWILEQNGKLYALSNKPEEPTIKKKPFFFFGRS